MFRVFAAKPPLDVESIQKNIENITISLYGTCSITEAYLAN